MRKENDLLFDYVKARRLWVTLPRTLTWVHGLVGTEVGTEWTVRKWKLCLKSNLSSSFSGRGSPEGEWELKKSALLRLSFLLFIVETFLQNQRIILCPFMNSPRSTESIIFYFLLVFLWLISSIVPSKIFLSLRCNLHLVKFTLLGI